MPAGGGGGGGMSRMLGLGFLFGGRDTGAVRTANALTEGLDGAADAANEAGRSAGMIQRLGDAIGDISASAVNGLESALSRLSDSAAIPDTTTSLESFGAEFSNTFRRATVGLGPFQDRVDAVRGQISGLAYSLDVDANDMIQAVTAVARTDQDLDDFGVSLRGVAGSIQAGILSGQELGTMLASLSEGYELGGEGAGRLVDRVTAIGESFGYGADAVRRLPAIIAAADPILSRFGNLSIEGVTESVTRLSTAMSRGLGISFEAASDASVQLFTHLGDQRAQLADLFTGMGEVFPDFATRLSIGTGDIDEAMSDILQDPLTFTDSMRELFGTLQRGSPQWDMLVSQLSAVNPNLAFMVTGGEEVGQALTDAHAPVTDFAGAFNQMATRASGTTRTFAESLERLDTVFRTRLNHMATISESDVLGRTRNAFNRLGDTLQGFSDRGGPLGFLTDAFLNVRRFGIVQGLLPMLGDSGLGRAFPQLSAQIEEFAPMLGDVGGMAIDTARDFAPMLTALPAMMTAMTALGGAATTAWAAVTGPIGLTVAAVAAVAAVGYLLYENWEDIPGYFEQAGEMLIDLGHSAGEWARYALDSLYGWSSRFSEWVASIDWVAVGVRVREGLSNAFTTATEWISSLFRSGGFFSELATSFFDGFGKSAEDTADMLPDYFGEIFTNVSGAIGDMVYGLAVGVLGQEFVTGFIEGIRSNLNRFERVADFVMTPFVAMYHVFDFLVLTPLTRAFGEMSAFFGGMTETMGADFEQDIGPLATVASDTFEEIGIIVEELWTDTLEPVFGFISDWWHEQFDGEIVPNAEDGFKDAGRAGRSMWQDYVRPALRSFASMSLEVISFFAESWTRSFQQTAHEAVDHLSTIMVGLTTLRVTFEHARDVMAAGWELVGLRIQSFFLTPMLQAGNSWSTFIENMETGFSAIRHSFLTLGDTILTTLNDAFNALPSFIRDQLGVATTALTQAQESMHDRVVSDQHDMERMEQDIARAREERTQAMLDQQQRVADAEGRLARVRDSYAQHLHDEISPILQMRDRALSGIDRFSDRLATALEHMRDRVASLSGDEQAAAREMTTTLEDARTVSQDIERGMREGTIATDRAARMTQQLADAAESGDSDAVRRVRAQVEGPTPATVAETHEPTAPARHRARAREEASAAAADAATSTAARELAEQIMVSSFGPEAVRQLTTAMGGAPGRRSGRAPRTSPALIGGGGAEQFE